MDVVEQGGSGRRNEGDRGEDVDGVRELEGEFSRLRNLFVHDAPQRLASIWSNARDVHRRLRAWGLAGAPSRSDGSDQFSRIGEVLGGEYDFVVGQEVMSFPYQGLDQAYRVADHAQNSCFVLRRHLARAIPFQYGAPNDLVEISSALKGAALAVSLYRNLDRPDSIVNPVYAERAILVLKDTGIVLTETEQDNFAAAITLTGRGVSYEYMGDNIKGVFPRTAIDADRLTISRPIALHRGFVRLLAEVEKSSGRQIPTDIDEVLNPAEVGDYFTELSRRCLSLRDEPFLNPSGKLANVARTGCMVNNTRFLRCAGWIENAINSGKVDKPLQTLFEYSKQLTAKKSSENPRRDLWAFAYTNRLDPVEKDFYKSNME